MLRQAWWLAGLALLLVGCAVKPMTPPAALDATALPEVTAVGSSPSPAAVTVIDTQMPTATGIASVQLSQSPMSPATIVATVATVPTDATPTPVLIVVANVALVPASTATPRPAVSVARANPPPTAVPPILVAPPVSSDVAAAERYTVDLINAQRGALGLASLAAEPTLMSIANGRVADMVTRGYTGHNDPSTGVALGPALMRAAGFGGLVGENWYGSRLGPPSIADVAMKWFMTDPPHYHNILNPHYSGVGVGIAYNGQQWLLVQDFAGN